MIRHIFAFIILGLLLVLLGFFYMNPDSYTYQTQNSQHIPDFDSARDNIPDSKYDTELARNHPFIFWLVENQFTIFIVLVIISVANSVYNYKKKGKFYHNIQKLFKE